MADAIADSNMFPSGVKTMPEATKMPVKTEKTTAPARANQWAPFESLRREIDRLFDDLRPFDWHLPSARTAFGFEMPKLSAEGWVIAPAMDLVEKEKEYEISAELPGIDEKNVEIKLVNGTLTIKGEKNEEKEEKQKDYYLSERRFGSFQRSFALPEGVDTDKIEASFVKGVLTVKLPKSPEAQKAEKKITVRAA
jgi:HSP20 family protein